MEEKITIEKLISVLEPIMQMDEIIKIKKAYQYIVEKHQGEMRFQKEFFLHPLSVAFILTDLHVDSTTICAALLHEVLNKTETPKEELEEYFGNEIADIVDSISKINHLELPDDSESSAIYLRKVLVGLAKDVRVIFIKLADRLHTLRNASFLNLQEQKQKANETMSVLVPIASRLGINSIKSELENLSLYCLKPDVYQDILTRLSSSEEELKDVLEEMQDSISNILMENGIHFYIKSRVKSVHSIYNKLNNGKKWNNIYDILALRIIVDKVSDCYTAIGLIHAKYRPMPGRFKDYIAMPKENMYQSLHTGVFGVDGNCFEIQIRTWEMDEIAEKGIASHWSYKEKGTKKVQNMMEQKLEVFRSLIEANEEKNDTEFATTITNDFLSDFIYVFTPKGDVVELPKGSTPVDFAYRIHTAVGDKVVGAIVNDAIVPLNYELSDHDIVKINTKETSTPSKEWLQFVKTSQAKNKIKSYFNKQDRENYIQKGKEILESTLRKKKLSFENVLNNENIKKVCKDLKLDDLNEIYFAIGTLRYTPIYIINLTMEDKKNVQDALIEKVSRSSNIQLKPQKSEIIVAGDGNILVTLAKCCHPVRGDAIKGYVTKGEGVSVHLENCPNIKEKTERIIDVCWNAEKEGNYYTTLRIFVLPGKNYLLDIIACATTKNIYIDSVKTKEDNTNLIYEMNIKVKNKEELDGFISNLEQKDFVKGVKRI